MDLHSMDTSHTSHYMHLALTLSSCCSARAESTSSQGEKPAATISCLPKHRGSLP